MSIAVNWLCVFGGYCLGAAMPSSDRLPPRLRSILESQRARTSQIEWTVSWTGGYDNGLVERYMTRTAGDTIWQSNRGDEKGYHAAEFEPHPAEASDRELGKYEKPKEKYSGTRNCVVYEDQVWGLQRAERSVVGEVMPLREAAYNLPIDIAGIGLAPCLLFETDATPFRLPKPVFEGFDSAIFDEGFENGLPTVTAVYANGRSRLTWVFDDRRGGKPVRATYYQHDEPVYYSEAEYEQIGVRWLPKSVRFYKGDSASPYKMIDVQRATFDEPWHMQEITPTDIGALYGTQFWGPGGLKMWTGAELIPDDEFWELVELYDVPPDPRITEMIAAPEQTAEQLQEFWHRRMQWRREEYRKKYGEEPWLITKSPKEKDEWDLYVEEFLAKHKLPEPGVKRANEVRDQAKKLRDAYRRKNAAALRKAKEENDSRKVQDFEGIEKRIFDRVLVRELKKLVHDEKDSPQK